MMRARTLIFAIVSAAGILATQFAGAAELESLKVQFSSIPVPAFAALFVAKESGAYEKAGLDVELIPGRLSGDTLNAVLAGTTDLAFILSISQILAADKGQKVVTVGNFYGRNAYGVIASEESGVAKLADLEDKTILVSLASYETLLRALIADEGGDPNKVQYVQIPQPAAMLSAYVGKQADAVTTIIPFARSGVEGARPSTYIPFAESGDPEPLHIFVARPDVVEQKSEAIRKFLVTTYETMGTLNSAPETMVDAYVRAVPGAKRERVVAEYKDWMEFQCAPGQSIVGAPSTEAIETALALYHRVKLTATLLKADDLITNKFFTGPNPVSTTPCPQ